MRNEDLGKLLAFDPIDYAEQIVDDRDAATFLAIGLAQQNAAKKNAELDRRRDTKLVTTLAEYVEIVKREGFEFIFREPFVDPDFGREQHNALYVFARRDGLLLYFDSYRNDDVVNSGKLCYNWQPNETFRAIPPREQGRITSSYSYITREPGGPLSGDHDCREALIFNIERLSLHGDFITPWLKRPFFWIASYRDFQETNHLPMEEYTVVLYDRTAERIAKFPPWVQEMIGAK